MALRARPPMNLSVSAGEFLRWYVLKAAHPFKDKIVGNGWPVFEKLKPWLRYDGNLLIRVSLQDYIGREIFSRGYYEPALVEFLKKTLSREDVFWDVGANIGAVSLIAAGHCRQVVAFEPDPRSTRFLKKNISANRFQNIRLETCALSEKAGTRALYQSPKKNTGMTSLLKSPRTGASQVEVRSVTADEYAAAHPGEAPTVIKIDVEGAERLVLEGARRVLSGGSVKRIIFEGHPGSELEAIFQMLKRAGFSVREFGRSDATIDDLMTNYLAERL